MYLGVGRMSGTPDDFALEYIQVKSHSYIHPYVLYSVNPTVDMGRFKYSIILIIMSSYGIPIIFLYPLTRHALSRLPPKPINPDRYYIYFIIYVSLFWRTVVTLFCRLHAFSTHLFC